MSVRIIQVGKNDKRLLRLVEKSTLDPYLEDMAKTRLKGKAFLLLVNGEGRAFAIPRKDSDGRLRSGPIYVEEGFRRNGYAEALLTEIFKGARGRAFIEKDNVASQRTFAKVGFTRSGKTMLVEDTEFEEWLKDESLPASSSWR